jgi:hypothetical protein
MTNLSEAELKRRLDQLTDVKTGQVRGLTQLDAALAQTTSGIAKSTLDTYGTLTQRAETAHVVEAPEQAFQRAGEAAGYAPAAPEPASPQVSQTLDRAKTSGLKRIQASPLLADGQTPLAPGGNIDLAPHQQQLDADSRLMQFEQLKIQMNKINQITDLISNTLKYNHDTLKSVINNTKAS